MRGPVHSEVPKLKIHTTRARLLASSMICGVAIAASGHALAQQTSELVVTGSRIPQPNLTSTSPVTVVTDTERKLQGTVAIESLINNLPQAFANQTETASNGSTGTATVDLRDLGPKRTLVLVDGKRLMPADAASPSADLNDIPAALVDHVEVVTGGASAVYGSDAIAGVVNFVMKKDFEGVRLDAQYGIAQHSQHNDTAQNLLQGTTGLLRILTPQIPIPPDQWDGQTFDLTAVIGVNAPDGKGNATVYAGYRNFKAVTQDTRDFTACAVGSIADGANAGLYDSQICFGSSNIVQGRMKRTDIGGGKTFEMTGSRTPQAATDSYNFAPFNYLQRPDERYVAGGSAHYEVNSHLEAYTDVMFTDDHTVAQIAPSGAFGGINYTINCSNPLIGHTPAPSGAYAGLSQFDLLCGAGPRADGTVLSDVRRRMPEEGNRQDDLRHTAYKVDIGARGDIADGWSYDVYGQYGTTIYAENYQNEVSRSRLQNSLLVVADPRPSSVTFGQPVCQAVLSGTDPACIPADIFTQGGLSPAAANYVKANGFKEGATRESIVSGSITGDLGKMGLKSPGATDGVSVAFGAEYRREVLNLNVDNEFLTGDLNGQGGPTPNVSGGYNVYELFGEARAPIIQDQPFFKLLQLDLGYRYSDYSLAGQTNTFKVAGDWQPVDDIRFRASFQRAVRAPNVVELFTPQFVGLYGGKDPCAGGAPAGSFAGCLASYVPGYLAANPNNTAADAATAFASIYGHIDACPASQCSGQFAGNTQLSPETSDTWSFGTVLTPTFLHGFTASVDYFNIKVANLIGPYGAATSMGKCVQDSATADGQFFCGLIRRDPITGDIFGATSYVIDQTVNTGFEHTSGVDVAANYRTNFSDWHMGDWGSLALSFNGTFTKSLLIQPSPRIGQYECAGLYGDTCGTPVPKWRHMARVTWNSKWKFSVSAAWRYIAPVKLDLNDPNPLLNGKNVIGEAYGIFPDIVKGEAKIPAANYFDLSGTWTVKDGLTMRVGVNNIFDKDPPLLDSTNLAPASPPFGNGNTFPGVYDSLGRTIFVGLTADF